MKVPHIAQIGKWFPNADSFNFLSKQNINEYDFILIESDVFISAVTSSFLSTMQQKIFDLQEFIAAKNIPIVFFCFRGGSFFSNHANQHLSITSLMGIDCQEVESAGKKIEINSTSLFADLMKRNIESFEYKACFSNHPGTSIGKAKGKSDSIGFYTRDFVFLPALVENESMDTKSFLNDLYEICCLIRSGDDTLQLPAWSNKYLVPGEKEENQKLSKIGEEIKNLQQAQVQSELRLKNLLPLKQLWTASGATLEKAIKNVLIELGFTALPTEEYRDDLIMKLNGHVVIAEIKGLNKSAAEKNAAQLEKWLSTYISNHEGENPKGLLIVNTFKELPLEERTQESFPHQMLNYSIARGHCLITTLQLCTLLLFSRAYPEKKEESLKKLLSTVGRMNDFNNWAEFIHTEKQPPQKKDEPKI